MKQVEEWSFHGVFWEVAEIESKSIGPAKILGIGFWLPPVHEHKIDLFGIYAQQSIANIVESYAQQSIANMSKTPPCLSTPTASLPAHLSGQRICLVWKSPMSERHKPVCVSEPSAGRAWPVLVSQKIKQLQLPVTP